MGDRRHRQAVMLVALFSKLAFLHSLICLRVEWMVLTAPILFTTAGMVAFLVLRPLDP